jgi:hypothetical protein
VGIRKSSQLFFFCRFRVVGLRVWEDTKARIKLIHLTWVLNRQGAQVASKAMAQLSADEAANVGAVVLFGNPNGDDPVPNTDAADVEVFCNTGDLICAGTATILPPHLTYGSDAGAAANFVAGRIQA